VNTALGCAATRTISKERNSTKLVRLVLNVNYLSFNILAETLLILKKLLPQKTS
jgi:hypothetical protein